MRYLQHAANTQLGQKGDMGPGQLLVLLVADCQVNQRDYVQCAFSTIATLKDITEFKLRHFCHLTFFNRHRLLLLGADSGRYPSPRQMIIETSIMMLCIASALPLSQ
jgi:hypothetical protein